MVLHGTPTFLTHTTLHTFTFRRATFGCSVPYHRGRLELCTWNGDIQMNKAMESTETSSYMTQYTTRSCRIPDQPHTYLLCEKGQSTLYTHPKGLSIVTRLVTIPLKS